MAAENPIVLMHQASGREKCANTGEGSCGGYAAMSACEMQSAMPPGSGFWIYSATETVRNFSGSAVTADAVTIPLLTGWNLIGSPFADAIPWNDNITVDGAPLFASDKIAPQLFRFDFESAQFVRAESLTPWMGYAVKAKAATSLTIPRNGKASQDIRVAPFAARDAASQADTGRTYVARQLIVAPAPGADRNELEKLVTSAGGRLVGANEPLGLLQAEFPEGVDLSAAKNILSAHKEVASVSLNELLRLEETYTPNDPIFAIDAPDGNRWGFDTVRAREVWKSFAAVAEPRIAVIDTGVDATHPDLAANMLPGVDYVGATGGGTDGNGHGTKAAGIAAAVMDNGTGIAGMCPDCRILPVKVCDDEGLCPLFAVIAGITWAARNGADVVNISISGVAAPGSDAWRMVAKAVDFAAAHNAVVVAAAGNGGADAANVIPAAIPAVIAVAASDPADRKTGSSNIGAAVDVAAPGANIYTTAPGGYGTLTGTSAAAPFVAGLAGLLRSSNAELSSEKIRQMIVDSTAPMQPEGSYGFGRIDAAKAFGIINLASTTTVEIRSVICAPENVRPGEIAHCRVEVNATDTSGIAFQWSASAGTFASATGTETDWTAPGEANLDAVIEIQAKDTNGEIDAATTAVHVSESMSPPAGELPPLNIAAVPCIGNWTRFHCNNENTGESGAITLTPPLALLWSQTASNIIESSPVSATIAGTQRVFINVQSGIFTSYKVSNPGDSPVMRAGLSPGIATSTPVIANIGGVDVVFVGKGANVYALRADTLTDYWATTSFSLTNQYVSTAMLVSNNTLYFGAAGINNGAMYAISATSGALVWTFNIAGGEVHSSPALSSAGILYFGADNCNVYALSAATGGQVIAPFAVAGGDCRVRSSPALEMGNVYFGANNGRVYGLTASAFTPNGSYDTGSQILSSPAVVGTSVYVGAENGKLYSLSAFNLAWQWEALTGGAVRSSPVVSNGVVYVGSVSGKVFGFDAMFGNKVWEYPKSGTPPPVMSSPAIAGFVPRMIVGSTTDAQLRCFETNRPPVIASVNLPSSCITPGVVASILATVSDPNGIAAPFTNDIASVAVDIPSGVTGLPSTSTVLLYDDGGHGDSVAGDGIYGATFTVGTGSGPYDLPVTVTDKQGAAASEVAVLTVNPTPMLAGCAFATGSIKGDGVSATSLTCSASDANGNLSSLAVNLTPIGGTSNLTLYDDGAHGDGGAGDGVFGAINTTAATGTASTSTYSINVTATDTCGASTVASAPLNVTSITPLLNTCDFFPSSIEANGASQTTLVCTARDLDDSTYTYNLDVAVNFSPIFGSTSALYYFGATAPWWKYRTATMTAGFSTGTYTFPVWATDAFGLFASATTSPLTLTSPKPRIQSCLFTPGSVLDNGASATTLTCTITDGNMDLDRVLLDKSQIGGATNVVVSYTPGTWMASTFSASSTFSVLWRPPGVCALPTTRNFTVTAYDTEGSTAAMTVPLTLNPAPPVFTGCSFTPGTIPANGTTPTTLHCDITDPLIGATSTVAAETNLSPIGGASVTMAWNGVMISPTGFDRAGITAPASTTLGWKTFWVGAKSCGGATVTTAVNLNVSNPAPVVSGCSFSPVRIPANNRTTTALTCTVTDANDPTASLTVMLNVSTIESATPPVNMTAIAANTWRFIGITADKGMASSTYFVTVVATDPWGATGAATVPLIVDNVSPAPHACQFLPYCIDAGSTTNLQCLINDPTEVLAADLSVTANVASITHMIPSPATMTVTAAGFVSCPGGFPINAGTAQDDEYAACLMPITTFATIAPGIFNVNVRGIDHESAMGSSWAQLKIRNTSTGSVPILSGCTLAPTGIIAGAQTTTVSCNVSDGDADITQVSIDINPITNGGGFLILNGPYGATGTYSKAGIGASLRYTPFIPGNPTATVSLGIIAQDNQCNSTNTSVTLEVYNRPPSVTCGIAPASIRAGTTDTALLTCTITDPNGAPDPPSTGITTNITQLGGAANATMTAAPPMYTRTLSAPSGYEGLKVITVTSCDFWSLCTSATIPLTVTNQAPAIATCTYSPPAVPPLSFSTLTCVITDANDNLVGVGNVTVDLTAMGGPITALAHVGAATSATWVASVQAPAGPGTFVTPVTATDSNGASATASPVLYTDNPPAFNYCNFSPASIPANGASATSLVCSISDLNLDQVTVQLQPIRGVSTIQPLTNLWGGVWGASVTAPTPGWTPATYTITVSAVDIYGATAATTTPLNISNYRPSVTNCEFVPPNVQVGQSTQLICDVTDLNFNMGTSSANLSALNLSAAAGMTIKTSGVYLGHDAKLNGDEYFVATSTAAVIPASPLSSGAHIVFINATDTNGLGATTTATLQIDNTSPTISNCAFTPPSIVEGVASSTYLVCTATDPNQAVGSLNVTVDLSPIGGGASTALFDDGLHGDGISANNLYGAISIGSAVGKAQATPYTISISVRDTDGVTSIATTKVYVTRPSAATTPCSDDWPNFHCNPENTGENSNAMGVPRKRWEYPSGNPVQGGPTAVGNVVYVGTDGGRVQAIHATAGTIVWNTLVGGTITSAPAVKNGLVIVGTKNGGGSGVYALRVSDGGIQWQYATGSQICASPEVENVYGTDYVFVGQCSGNYAMMALRADTGALMWSYAAGSTIQSAAAVSDGKVYFTSGNKLYALDANTGAKIWQTQPQYNIGFGTCSAVSPNLSRTSPVVSGQYIFVGSERTTCTVFIWTFTLSGKLIAFDKSTGAVNDSRTFSVPGNYSVYDTPAISGGKAYFGVSEAGANAFYAVNTSNGTQAWSNTSMTGYHLSSPAVSGDRVIVGTTGGKVYVLSATSGVNLWTYPSDPGTFGAVYSSPAVAGPRFFIGNNAPDNKVYAFESNSPPTVANVQFGASIPPNGFSPTCITATVADANGLSDVSGVTVAVPAAIALSGATETKTLMDDGASGDGAAGDGVYGYCGIKARVGATEKPYVLTVTATDLSSQSGYGTGTLYVAYPAPPVIGACTFTPSLIPNDEYSQTVLTAGVTDPNGPSDILTVTANLAPIGGAAGALMNDAGGGNDAVAGDQVYTVTGNTVVSGSVPAGTVSMNVSTIDNSPGSLVNKSCTLQVVNVDPPTNLAAQTLCPDVRLTWDASPTPGYDHYAVYRSVNGAAYATLATGLTSTSTVDTWRALDPAMVSYKVRAYIAANPAKNTALTATATVTPSCMPNFLTVAPGCSMRLDWASPTSSIDPTFNPKYKVLRATAAGGPYATVAVDIAARTYTDTSGALADGQTYFYKVVLHKGGDPDRKSDYSNIVSETSNCTPDLAAPAKPCAPNSATVLLQWTPHGETGYDTYEIRRATLPGGPATHTVIIAGATSTAATDTTAYAISDYYYNVRASKSASPTTAFTRYSTQAYVFNNCPTTPNPPTISGVTSMGFFGFLEVDWTAPTTNTDGTPINDLASYELTRAGSGTIATPGATAVTYTDGGVVLGNNYCYTMRAVDSETPSHTSADSAQVCATSAISNLNPVYQCGNARQPHIMAPLPDGELLRPHEAAVDDSALWVYVTNSNNNRVEVYRTDQPVCSYAMKFGETGAGPNQFIEPKGIAYAEGKLFITDNKYLRECSPAGVCAIRLSLPEMISVSTSIEGGKRYIYVTSNYAGGKAYKYEYSATSKWKLKKSWASPNARGVAVSSAYVFVADQANHVVRRYDIADPSPANMTVFGSSNLTSPYGITVLDGAGENMVMVADYARNAIEMFSFDGTYKSSIGTAGRDFGQFYGVTDVLLLPDYSMFTVETDNDRLQKFTP